MVTMENCLGKGQSHIKKELLTQPAEVINRVTSLESLASSLNSFISVYNDLTEHLNLIAQSIDARLASQRDSSPSDHISTPQDHIKLKTAFETMNGKCLRKYLIQHRLHDVKMLREELPLAIVYSPKPSKLVLDCVGKFFKQSTRACETNHHLSQMRLLAVLVLESMFLAVAKGSIEVQSDDRKTADEWAFLWKKRLVSEGGISSACENDASGLLFLICAFGIHKHFTDDDIWNLVIVSMKEYGASLRLSLSLKTKLADIITKMMKGGMNLEALDVVRALKMEDQFPHEKILSAYTETRNEILRQRMKEAGKDPALQKKALHKHTYALNSALNFIKQRNYDTLRESLKGLIAKASNEDNDGCEKKRKTMEVDEEKTSTRAVKGREEPIKKEELVLGGEISSYRQMPVSWFVREPFPGFPTKLKDFVGTPPDGPPKDMYGFVDKVVEMEFGSNYLRS